MSTQNNTPTKTTIAPSPTSKNALKLAVKHRVRQYLTAVRSVPEKLRTTETLERHMKEHGVEEWGGEEWSEYSRIEEAEIVAAETREKKRRQKEARERRKEEEMTGVLKKEDAPKKKSRVDEEVERLSRKEHERWEKENAGRKEKEDAEVEKIRREVREEIERRDDQGPLLWWYGL